MGRFFTRSYVSALFYQRTPGRPVPPSPPCSTFPFCNPSRSSGQLFGITHGYVLASGIHPFRFAPVYRFLLPPQPAMPFPDWLPPQTRGPCSSTRPFARHDHKNSIPRPPDPPSPAPPRNTNSRPPAPERGRAVSAHDRRGSTGAPRVCAGGHHSGLTFGRPKTSLNERAPRDHPAVQIVIVPCREAPLRYSPPPTLSLSTTAQFCRRELTTMLRGSCRSAHSWGRRRWRHKSATHAPSDALWAYVPNHYIRLSQVGTRTRLKLSFFFVLGRPKPIHLLTCPIGIPAGDTSPILALA